MTNRKFQIISNNQTTNSKQSCDIEYLNYLVSVIEY